MTNTTRHPNLLLDVLVVAIGISLVYSASHFRLEPGHPATKGTGTIFGGIYLIYLGSLFLLSYFFSDTSYVFRCLMFICESFSRPAGRHMALVYFALGVLLGLGLLV